MKERKTTSRQTAKALERNVAKRLGLERSSKQFLGDDGADVHGILSRKVLVCEEYGGSVGKRTITHGEVIIECKLRARIPKILKDMIAQARSYRDREEIPIGVLHEKQANMDDAIVCLRLEDFESLLNLNVEGEELSC